MRIRWPLLLAPALCALAGAGLAFLVKTTPYIPLDAASARAIQSIDLGPLTSLFPLLSWAGGPGGPVVTAGNGLAVVPVIRPSCPVPCVPPGRRRLWPAVLPPVAPRPPDPCACPPIHDQPRVLGLPRGPV